MMIKRFGNKQGFTIIEMLVVIAIIGILAAIVVVSYSSWNKTIAVTQIKNDLSEASTALENARNFNDIYPSTIPSTFKASTDITLTGGSSDGITYCIQAVNTKYPSDIYHIDSANSNQGAQTGACTYSLTLAINPVGGGTASQSGTSPYSSGSTPTITATPNSGYAFSSWSGTNCNGSASHAIPAIVANMTCTANFIISSNYTLTYTAGANGSITGTNPQPNIASGGSGTAVTAVPATYYSFVNWSDSSTANPRTDTNVVANISVTANFTPTTISAPSAPVVTANTVGTDTTWSWPAVSCPGNSVRYQYRYTISPSAYDSGWIGPQAGTSVTFTTSTAGQTYSVAIQAQCYNTATASSWSASGSDSYTRIATYILTIVAGSNGTVNTGGTYDSGTNQLITAIPNGGYQFSSWSGSTGCSGVQSHTILMDANKSCTANFGVSSNWIAGVGNMVGKYVYNRDIISTDLYTTGSTVGSATIAWKTSRTACGNPQCVTGLDPDYPASAAAYSLVASNAVDFALGTNPPTYPARDACKMLGGRLPTENQLLGMQSYRATYGNNFGPYNDSSYWSSTEWDTYNPTVAAWTWSFYNLGTWGNAYKDDVGFIRARCVRG